MAGKINFQPVNWDRFDQMKALDNAFSRIESTAIQAVVPDVEIKQTQSVISKEAYSNDQVKSNVVGLFFCADIIFNRTKSLNVDGLGGIRNLAPKFNTMFMIIVLGSIALPLTNGFIGEFLLLFGVYEYNTWLSVFAALTIILGAVYMLRMFQNVMLGNTNETTSIFEDLKWNEILVLGILVIVIIVMGVYPKPVFELAEPALKLILNNALIK